MKIPDKPIHVFGLLIAAVAVLLHGNLNAPLFIIDDVRYLQHVAGRSWTEQLSAVPRFHYAPMTYLSLKLDMAIAGANTAEFLAAAKEDSERTNALGNPPTESAKKYPNPIGHASRNMPWVGYLRFMNAFYHALAGFLLWLALSRLGVGNGVSLFAAFVWTAHPAALESVAWVCERKNVLCAVGSFGTLAAWTLPRQKAWRWPLIWACFTFAVLSKISALSITPVLALLEFYAVRERPQNERSINTWFKSAACLAGVAAIGLAAIFHQAPLIYEDITPPPGGSAWTGLLTDANIFSRYVFNVFVPIRLSFIYGVTPILSLSDSHFWLGFLPLAGVCAALYLSAVKNEKKWVLVGLAWFFGGLLPNANLVGSAFPMQDRYTYLPMPGMLLALAFAIRGIILRLSLPEKTLSLAAYGYCIAILVMCGIRSHAFSSSEDLILDAARRYPQSKFANYQALFVESLRLHDAINRNNKTEAVLAATNVMQFGPATESNPDAIHFAALALLRAPQVTALIQLGRNADALKAVESIPQEQRELPLINALSPLLKSLAEISALSLDKSGSDLPIVCANAWRIHADTLLLMSFRTNLELEFRMRCANSAALSASRSAEIVTSLQSLPRLNRDQSNLLHGKCLIRVSYLLAAANRRDEAKSVFARARGILEAIGTGTEAGRLAAAILKNVPEP